jgi:hypothetical protein
MRKAMVLAALVIGCSAEQGFGESKPSMVEAGGEGRIELFPATGVEFGPFEIGHTEVGGFRIDSVGESSLRILSMNIIDAGENAGVAVFSELRPHVSSNVVPFDISEGEGAEFLLTAAMEEEGTSTGMIEIYTNDPTVEDPSPGYVRIPLSAVAVGASGSDGDDTGMEDTGTGDEDADGATGDADADDSADADADADDSADADGDADADADDSADADGDADADDSADADDGADSGSPLVCVKYEFCCESLCEPEGDTTHYGEPDPCDCEESYLPDPRACEPVGDTCAFVD